MNETLLKTAYFSIESVDGRLRISSTNGSSMCFITPKCEFTTKTKRNSTTLIEWELEENSQMKYTIGGKVFSLQKKRIVINAKYDIFLYQEIEAVDIKKNSSLWKITLYDNNFHIVKKLYGIIEDSPIDYKELCLIKDTHSYLVCINQMRVIDIWKDVVKIHSYDDTPLVFRGIQTCEQVVQKISDAIWAYSFYILKAAHLSIILNTRTMNYKAISYSTLFPTAGYISSKTYLFEGHYIINSNMEHLVIDKVVYDSRLNIVGELSLPYYSKVVDVCEKYISALSSDDDLYILKASEDWTSFKPIPYCYNLKMDKDFLTLQEYSNIHHIDCNTGKFIIDFSRLYHELLDKQLGCSDYDYGDDEEYYYRKYIGEDIGYENLDY